MIVDIGANIGCTAVLFSMYYAGATIYAVEPWFDRIDAISFEYHSERDRLEVDQLLRERFVLALGRVEAPHRGTLTYVSKSVLAMTDANRLEIPRPFL